MKPEFSSYEEVEEWYLPYTKVSLPLKKVADLAYEMTHRLLECENFEEQKEDYWYRFKEYDLNIWQPDTDTEAIYIALYAVNLDGSTNYDEPIWKCGPIYQVRRDDDRHLCQN